MASLERTAYPVLSRSYSRAELQREFSFSEEEVTWVKSRSNAAFRLNLAVLFKTFQVLRYFPEIAEVPEPVVDFIRTQIGLRSKVALSPYKWMQLYRHMSAVREKLGVRPFYGSDGQDIASTHAQLMAPLLEQRADIINAIIDELLRQNYELPAYSTLNDLAEAARASVFMVIYHHRSGEYSRSPVQGPRRSECDDRQAGRATGPGHAPAGAAMCCDACPALLRSG